ncbi:MAG: PQQ-binding-like beta-propeller repeat protein, partial [Planctomycetota bacterium]
WGTPTIDVSEGRRQLICNGWRHIGGYDLDTGEELWKLEGGGDIPVPTPIVAHDLIFSTNAHGRQKPIYAIDVAAEGKLTINSEFMAWNSNSLGIYMQTPLVYDTLLYCCKDNGVLTAFDSGTGDQIYRERVGSGDSGYTASMVAADGKLYVTSEEGEVSVIRAGPEFEVLAVNELGEECMATPAISAGVLYFRTRGHLIAIGE